MINPTSPIRAFACLFAATFFAVGAGADNAQTPPPTTTEVAKPAAGDHGALRENIEWTHLWLTGADKKDKPHVLLVGDSITKAYADGVTRDLARQAYVGSLTTSLCVCDPAFEPTLQAALAQGDFAVIHFNNGLHGVGYTEAQYQAGYEKALKLIRKTQPQAKIIIALSTPLKPGSDKAKLNPRIDQRNASAIALAKTIGAPIDDLSGLMKEHAGYYTDPYHYQGKGIALQVTAVAAAVRKELGQEPAAAKGK